MVGVRQARMVPAGRRIASPASLVDREPTWALRSEGHASIQDDDDTGHRLNHEHESACAPHERLETPRAKQCELARFQPRGEAIHDETVAYLAFSGEYDGFIANYATGCRTWRPRRTLRQWTWRGRSTSGETSCPTSTMRMTRRPLPSMPEMRPCESHDLLVPVLSEVCRRTRRSGRRRRSSR